MSLTHGDPSGWAAQPHMAIPQARLRWREGEGGPLLSHTRHHASCHMYMPNVAASRAPRSLAASQVLEACGADERNHNLRAVLPKGCAALARVLAPGDLARLSVRRRRTLHAL